MEEQYTLEEWLGMMEEGKLSRLAAGVGLGAAAMMGGAKDAEAQAKSEPAPTTTTRSWTSTMGRNSDGAPTPPKDSTSTQTSRDMQMAVDKAAFDLKSRGIDPRTVAGFKRDIKQNPDGTWSVTMKPNTENPPMEETYTLEEWTNALQEAGYDLEEGFMDTLRSAGRQVRDTAKGAGRIAGAVGAAARGGDVGSGIRTVGNFVKGAYINPSQRGYGKDSPGGDARYDPKSGPEGKRHDNTLQAGSRDYTDTRTGQSVRGSVLGGVKNVLRAVRDVGQNPSGVKYADITRDARSGELARDAQRPIPTNEPQMYDPSESYTLEEWFGMMEEAGYKVNEISPELRNKVFRIRQAQAERERRKMPQLYQNLDAERKKGDAWKATLPPEQRPYATYANQTDAGKAIDQTHNAAIGLDRKASQTFYAGKKGDRLADRDPSPSSPSDAEIAAAPSLSQATQRTIKNASKMEESINENTVSRLQQLAGIVPLN